MLPIGHLELSATMRKGIPLNSLYGIYMLDWLYEIFVSIVTFIMSLFGFDLNKRSVALESSAPKAEQVEQAEKAEQVEQAEQAEHAEPVAETATELP